MNSAKKEEKDAKDLARNDEYLNIVLSIMEASLSRLDIVNDPMAKHLMFLDRLSIMSDMAMAGLSTAMTKVTPETKERCRLTIETFNDKIKGLVEWVQTPSYHPDHPYGNNIMKESEESFKSEGK